MKGFFFFLKNLVPFNLQEDFFDVDDLISKIAPVLIASTMRPVHRSSPTFNLGRHL